MKKIIAILGMAGSGKSEAANYFIKKGFSYVRLGQIVMDEIKKRNLELSEKNEKIIRDGFRKKLGMAAFAILNTKKINKIKNDVVIDGLYSWEEYVYFKHKYKNLLCLSIYASPKTRYQRLVGRDKKHKDDPQMKFRSFTLKEAKKRDISEIQKSSKGGPIAMADYTIINEASKKVFLDNLDKVYRRING